jgi:hypothetical protein
MQGEFWIIKEKGKVEKTLGHFKTWVEESWDFSSPLVIQPKPYRNPRSYSQNALLHKWFDTMANHFSKKVDTNAEEMKALMKYKFLGVEDVVVGKTVIKDQLKSTAKLTKGEMMHFMDSVYDWAADHGVLLPIPENSEYKYLRGSQNE